MQDFAASSRAFRTSGQHTGSRVNVRTTTCISHAYVINQPLIEPPADKSPVRAIQALFAAADKIDLGLHKTRDTKDRPWTAKLLEPECMSVFST
jgi:hypothetical protein